MKDKKLMCPWCYPAVQMVLKHNPNKRGGSCGGIAWFECPNCQASTPVVVYGPKEYYEEIAYTVATASYPQGFLASDQTKRMDGLSAECVIYDENISDRAARPTDADIVAAHVTGRDLDTNREEP